MGDNRQDGHELIKMSKMACRLCDFEGDCPVHDMTSQILAIPGVISMKYSIHGKMPRMTRENGELRMIMSLEGTFWVYCTFGTRSTPIKDVVHQNGCECIATYNDKHKQYRTIKIWWGQAQIDTEEQILERFRAKWEKIQESRQNMEKED